jgi:hypothetical protein
MAEAAGHKWGQFIGEYCESALEPLLQEFANKHGLYLDKKGAVSRQGHLSGHLQGNFFFAGGKWR